MVTYALGEKYGVIENGLDGYEIIRDAALFLRDPKNLVGELRFWPAPSIRTIGFGQSQTAMLLRYIVLSGQHRDHNGVLVYDGILAGGGGGLCLVLNNDEAPRPEPGPTVPTFGEYEPCGGPLPEEVRYISLNAQSDVGFFAGHLTRHETPSYRQYDLAGVAHIPPEILDLGLMGAKRQNPVGFIPAFKAVLRNLAEWIVSGKAPPASLYIDGALNGEGQFEFANDDDGNVTGGLRLPHMAVVLKDGKRAGAPLGVYGGIDAEFLDPLNMFITLGGTFESFSAQELAARYPSNRVYVDLVSKSAAALLADRFILAEDYEAYVEAAKRRR